MMRRVIPFFGRFEGYDAQSYPRSLGDLCSKRLFLHIIAQNLPVSKGLAAPSLSSGVFLRNEKQRVIPPGLLFPDLYLRGFISSLVLCLSSYWF